VGDVEVEVDGIRGNGRIPDDEIEIPPALPDVSVRLLCFLVFASKGCRAEITAGGGAFTLVDLEVEGSGWTLDRSSSSSPAYPY
jgi:hypothetical protein